MKNIKAIVLSVLGAVVFWAVLLAAMACFFFLLDAFTYVMLALIGILGVAVVACGIYGTIKDKFK